MKKIFSIIMLSLIFIGYAKADVTGTWRGSIAGSNVIVIIDTFTWILHVPGYGVVDGGTYTLTNNAAAGLHSLNLNIITGTATVINHNTINVILNSNSDWPGRYTFIRVSGNVSSTTVDSDKNRAIALYEEVKALRIEFMRLGRDVTQEPFGRAESIYLLSELYVQRGMYTESLPGLGQAKTYYLRFLGRQ